jgi:hypothetical protein
MAVEAMACVTDIEIKGDLILEYDAIASHAGAVFLGEVVALDEIDDDVLSLSVGVRDKWKGEIEAVVVVKERDPGIACVSRPKVGSSYVFLPEIGSDGELWVTGRMRVSQERASPLIAVFSQRFWASSP